jgi:hypothetical protein
VDTEHQFYGVNVAGGGKLTTPVTGAKVGNEWSYTGLLKMMVGVLTTCHT